MFLGLLDPDPDPLVRGMVPDPDLLSLSKNSEKNLDFHCFVTSFENENRRIRIRIRIRILIH
jgi:hypothetical protein